MKKHKTMRNACKIAMAAVLLSALLFGFAACGETPAPPNGGTGIVTSGDSDEGENQGTTGENQGDENQGGNGENTGENQGDNGENTDDPAVDPNPTEEELTYAELTANHETAYRSFIDALAAEVLSDQGLDPAEVTEYSCTFTDNTADTSVSSVELEIKTETTTYKIEVTFDTPLTYTAISYFDTTDAKGEAGRTAIREATSDIVEEITAILKFEDLTAEQQATINENLFPALEAVLIKSLKYLATYDAANILNYEWHLGEIDENYCVQNLEVTCEYKGSDTNIWYRVYTVELTTKTSIFNLATKGYSPTYNQFSVSNYKYSTSYIPAKQTEHLDIINAISAKLAEADNTFDYVNARVIQRSWGSGVSDIYGSCAVITLAYISGNEIREIAVGIKSSGTGDAYYANILNYLNQGIWEYGIEKDVTLSDNQLAEVDLTTQATNGDA